MIWVPWSLILTRATEVQKLGEKIQGWISSATHILVRLKKVELQQSPFQKKLPGRHFPFTTPIFLCLENIYSTACAAFSPILMRW